MLSLGDYGHSQIQEVERSTGATPVPNSSVATLPPCSNSVKRRNRSAAWDHFIKEQPESEKIAKCKYCGSLIKYGGGTSAMSSHLTRCHLYPDRGSFKRQRTTPSDMSPTYYKFDQRACRDELIKMFVVAELPFRFVENEAFIRFLSVLQPRFSVPSRSTLARDILTLFNEEKAKLKKFLFKNCRRACLTTDTWTSCQNLNYMSLTAHFINNDWKLQKKIIAFCQVSSHAGEVLGKYIDSCLNDMDLNRVFSMTVDNATSNDVAIQYLKRRITSWDCGVVLNADYIHVRCCAHIMALIVKEGLSEIDDSIFRIRSAVRYVRSSPSRMAKFKACALQEKIPHKHLVCLDVETRWNSTYLMLEAAQKYEQAFGLLELRDTKFKAELNKPKEKGVPNKDDWNYARGVLPFLKMFNDSTERLSGTSYVTSILYMKEVFAIGRKINNYCEHNDFSISLMANRMKSKFDKYWGNPDRINILLLIAVVFDPRNKLDYVNFCIDKAFDTEKAFGLKSKLATCINLLYNQYEGVEEGSETHAPSTQMDDNDEDFYSEKLFLQSTGHRFDSSSELDKYLKEDIIASCDFDLLGWWKVNATRFPILASIAREVLAIPVSTVASESAFSTGGRVLDPYRSSLTPTTVEALICTQDWLKGTPFSLLSDEDFQELARFEQEMTREQEVSSSTVISLHD